MQNALSAALPPPVAISYSMIQNVLLHTLALGAGISFPILPDLIQIAPLAALPHPVAVSHPVPTQI